MGKHTEEEKEMIRNFIRLHPEFKSNIIAEYKKGWTKDEVAGVKAGISRKNNRDSKPDTKTKKTKTKETKPKKITQQASDNDIEQSSKEKLYQFILKKYPNERRRRKLKVVFLSKGSLLEYSQVYKKAKINPEYIIAIEEDRVNFDTLKHEIDDNKYLISISNSSPIEFFQDTNQKFDIISLDLQEPISSEAFEIIRVIFDNNLLKSPGILHTSFDSKKEKKRIQEFWKHEFGGEIQTWQRVVELEGQHTEFYSRNIGNDLDLSSLLKMFYLNLYSQSTLQNWFENNDLDTIENFDQFIHTFYEKLISNPYNYSLDQSQKILSMILSRERISYFLKDSLRFEYEISNNRRIFADILLLESIPDLFSEKSFPLEINYQALKVWIDSDGDHNLSVTELPFKIPSSLISGILHSIFSSLLGKNLGKVEGKTLEYCINYADEILGRYQLQLPNRIKLESSKICTNEEIEKIVLRERAINPKITALEIQARFCPNNKKMSIAGIMASLKKNEYRNSLNQKIKDILDENPYSPVNVLVKELKGWPRKNEFEKMAWIRVIRIKQNLKEEFTQYDIREFIDEAICNIYINEHKNEDIKIIPAPTPEQIIDTKSKMIQVWFPNFSLKQIELIKKDFVKFRKLQIKEREEKKKIQIPPNKKSKGISLSLRSFMGKDAPALPQQPEENSKKKER